MYDKTKHPSLAKWMWFMLIWYAIMHRMEPLDLGGGSDDWLYTLRHREQYPNGQYKWIYVPEKAKRDPFSEPRYHIQACQLLLKE
jgi:hypothetical protein